MTAPLHPRTSSTAGPTAGPTTPPALGMQTWDADRDPVFFRLVVRLFRPSTALAMTVLLASNDDEPPAEGCAPVRPSVVQRGARS